MRPANTEFSCSQISERLAIVESVVGIDPLSECTGDFATDRCDEGSCPLQNNSIRRIGLLITSLLQNNDELRCWAEELERIGNLPEGTWQRAVLRSRMNRLERRKDELQQAKDAAHGIDEIDSMLKQTIKQIQDDIDTITNSLVL